MLLLGARDGTPLCFANRASLTPVLRQDPSKTSELKTVHRTVFLTLLTLLGFKSRLFLIRTDKNGVFTRNTPFPWCERRDLNPYGITTRPSNVRVCRFRHSRNYAAVISTAECIIANKKCDVNIFCFIF